MLEDLLANNKSWAEEATKQDADYFKKLSGQQTPQYLWIGCSDSRVPANQITGLAPGEIFVHRNVANVVVHTDLNCLSVMQFAVDVLKVKHVIVCGHYGCGGVQAALSTQTLGLIDNWIRHIQDVRWKHQGILSEPPSGDDWKRLCELNVVEQVLNVAQTTVIRQAWERGQDVSVHGWVYGLEDGILRDLGINLERTGDIDAVYRAAVAAVATKARA